MNQTGNAAWDHYAVVGYLYGDTGSFIDWVCAFDSKIGKYGVGTKLV
jgi:hypothetical protein